LLERHTAPPPLRLTLENCKYRSDARDNLSQFIKGARRVVGSVDEVLMFESNDII
jgi:hypothetical protein